jgi:glucose-1-phosphate cytidylyltransferase
VRGHRTGGNDPIHLCPARLGVSLKAVILAGGLGTRISEESHLKPKPMIEIGGKPILWHIMKIYGAQHHRIRDLLRLQGLSDQGVFRQLLPAHVGCDDRHVAEPMEVHQRYADPWKVTLVDTGAETQTGGRLRRVREHLDGTFCLTYGDGVTDLNISDVVIFTASRMCRQPLPPCSRPGASARWRSKTPGHAISGKAAWRRALGQRRLFRLRAIDHRPDLGR